MLRRRGRPESPAWSLWHGVVLVARDMDDLAAEPGTARAVVPRLDAAVRALSELLPAPDGRPSTALLALLDTVDEASPEDAALSALVEVLAEAAASLVGVAGAPVARDEQALRREAAQVLGGVGPVLTAWAERLPGVVPVVVLPHPESQSGDRY